MLVQLMKHTIGLERVLRLVGRGRYVIALLHTLQIKQRKTTYMLLCVEGCHLKKMNYHILSGLCHERDNVCTK